MELTTSVGKIRRTRGWRQRLDRSKIHGIRDHAALQICRVCKKDYRLFESKEDIYRFNSSALCLSCHNKFGQ